MAKTKRHEKSPAAGTAEQVQSQKGTSQEYQKSEDVSSPVARKLAKRARGWTFIVYPPEVEPNTPIDWRERIDEFCVPWVESPLHGGDYRDNYEEIPESERDVWWPYKKPHIHVILYFPNPRAKSAVDWLCGCINATRPESVMSVGGEVRYLAHYTYPEKTQYPISEIKPHNGFIVAKHFEPEVDNVTVTQEIAAYVVESGCCQMTDVYREAMRRGCVEWVSTLGGRSGTAYFVETLLAANRREASEQRERAKAPAVCEGNIIRFEPAKQAEGSVD